MKKILSICVIASIMIGCKNKANQEAEILQAKQMTIDSITKVEDIRKTTIDSMNAVAAAKAKEDRVVVVKTVPSKSSSNSSNSGTTTTTTTRKKGWSSTAKGAVIGAGVGGITGAMIDKKNGL